MSIAPKLPQLGTDATGQADFAEVLTASRDCSHIMMYATSGTYYISFDGSTTHLHFYGGAVQYMVRGISIPKGTKVYAKNASAPYSNLRVMIW